MGKSLPKGWVEVQLIELLKDFQTGTRPKGGVQGILEGIPSIGGEHLNAEGGFNFKNIKYIPEDFAKNLNRGKIKIHDILIVKDGATTGKTSFVNSEFPFDKAFVNEHVFLCRPFSNFPSKLLYYFLRSSIGQDRILANFAGAAQGGINTKFASNTIVNFPPLPEQERIVCKLDKLFAQHEKIKKALDRIPQLLKDFRQQVLTQAVTGKLTEQWREGKELEGWKIQTIHELVNDFRKDVRTGPFGSALKKSDHRLTGLPVWGIESIGINGKFTGINKIFITLKKAKELSSFKANGGDIIISRSGTVGELCIIPDQYENGYISTNLLKIALNNKVINSLFFCWLFKADPNIMEDLKEQCKGSTRLFLTQTILKNLHYNIPPLIEQQEIVRRVETLFAKADAIEARYQTLKAKVESLPQTILHKAFKGELVPQLITDGNAQDLLNEIMSLKMKVKGNKNKQSI